jgi:hypothetical protein
MVHALRLVPCADCEIESMETRGQQALDLCAYRAYFFYQFALISDGVAIELRRALHKGVKLSGRALNLIKVRARDSLLQLRETIAQRQ